jgi:hypothetical protein
MSLDFSTYEPSCKEDVSDLVKYIQGEYRNASIPERFYVVVENPTEAQKLAIHQYLELMEKQNDN